MLASTFWVIRFCIIVAWHTVALHLWTFGAEKREKDYIANGGRSGEQHGETIDTDADESRRVLRVRRGDRELVADFAGSTAEIR